MIKTISAFVIISCVIFSYKTYQESIIGYSALLNVVKEGLQELLHVNLSAIQPGTKWCGAGTVAESYNDLGTERETDKCCRDHDFCEESIEAGATKFNLTNDAFYTRLSCECDELFRDCLRATKKRIANNIGTVYFNALGTKCFRYHYPAFKCVKRGGWLKRKCLEYTFNMTEEKRYQWFDVIDY